MDGSGDGYYRSPQRGWGQRPPRYNNYNSPGGGGGGWQQQRSPYRPRQQHGYRQNSPFCSTPINQRPYHHRPYRPNFSGGQNRRGGGRFNSPGAFNDNQGEQQQGIDAWVSPQMWDDPWKPFTPAMHQAGDDETGNELRMEDDNLSTTKIAHDLSTSSENITAASQVLDVSDMILRSFNESAGGVDGSANPLPDISLDLLNNPTSPPPSSTATPPHKKTDEDKGESIDLDKQTAQDCP